VSLRLKPSGVLSLMGAYCVSSPFTIEPSQSILGQSIAARSRVFACAFGRSAYRSADTHQLGSIARSCPGAKTCQIGAS